MSRTIARRPRLIPWPRAAVAAALLALPLPALAQYGPAGGGSQQPPAGGGPARDAAGGDEGEVTLPMTFVGDGMTIDIRAIDPNTGTFTGTLTLAGASPMPYQVQIQGDQFGNQFGFGQVQTANGPRPLRVVDESDAVAQIGFEGKVYRVVKGAPVPPPPAAEKQPATGPATRTTQAAPDAPFGVGVKPHESMPGWIVTEVTAASLAETAGVKVGDVIIDAKDADGKGVQIQPSLGFEPLRGVLGRDRFSLMILRQTAQPPLLEIKVERPTRQAAPAKADDATQRADAGSKPAGSVVLTKRTLNDPGMNNMPSHTVLAPKDWTVTGGGWWPGQDYFNIAPSQDITVAAPDGRAVRFMPGLSASDFRPDPQLARQSGIGRPQEGSSDNGKPVLYMPADLGEWGEWMRTKSIPARESGASDFTVDKVTIVPELTEMVRKQLEPIRQQQQQQDRMMGGSQSFCDGAFLAFDCSYTKDGRRWEMGILLGTGYLGFDSQVGRNLTWWIDPAVSFVAPAGELDAGAPLMMAVVNSMQPTPQWAAMKAEHLAKMSGITAKGAAERSRIIAEGSRQLAKIRQDDQTARDRQQEKFVNVIRGTEDYVAPGGGDPVQLPNNYDHVYTNGNGEYLLTNDSLYNPNTDAAVNERTWETMQAKP